MPKRLVGRRILVTGGSSGIGRAVAEQCVAEGAQVACLARNARRLGAVSESIGALAVPADVLDSAEIQAAVSEVVQRFGGLDGLVNSAGVYRPGKISVTGLDDWRQMFEVNVLGLLNVTKAASAALCNAGQSDIVNISSMGGRRIAGPMSAVYSATKFAVHALTDGLRLELHEHGVRVCVVAPGAVATEFGLADADPEEAERMLERRSRVGLSPGAVGGQVVHVLAQPADATIREIAMTSTAQGPT